MYFFVSGMYNINIILFYFKIIFYSINKICCLKMENISKSRFYPNKSNNDKELLILLLTSKLVITDGDDILVVLRLLIYKYLTCFYLMINTINS